jgi:hypothetical protein
MVSEGYNILPIGRVSVFVMPCFTHSSKSLGSHKEKFSTQGREKVLFSCLFYPHPGSSLAIP